MFREINRELDILDKEEYNIANVLDPPEMRGRRTFGRGGQRQLTAAEIIEKELQQNDKRPTESETPVVES